MSSTPVQTYFSDPHVNARRSLDEEIAQLEARLLVLKLARNALAPFTRLHSEILQDIFFLAHTTSQNKGKTSLIITWVSHKWRELAHHTSALWSYIDFEKQEWVETAISRTRNRELEFSYDRTWWKLGTLDSSFRHLTGLCLGNLNRIRRLVIRSDGDKEIAFPPLSPEWLNPAPLLVELHLNGLSLPPCAFSGTFPALESLHLSVCLIDWDTIPVRSGLKELVLLQPTSRTDIGVVLRILRVIGSKLERLQFLDVFGPLDSASITHGNLVNRIRFPKLKILQLDEEHGEIIGTLLAHMSLPRRLTMEICMPEYRDFEDMIPALIASRDVEQWPVEYLDISTEVPSIVLRVVEDWSKADDGTDHDQDAEERTHIELKVDYEDFKQAGPIFGLLPIHPIKTVLFHSSDAESRDILAHIGELGTVQELRLELPTSGIFMDFIDGKVTALEFLMETRAISINGEEGVDDAIKIRAAQSVLSFQNLRQLKIFGVPKWPRLFERDDVESLHKWLAQRKAHGFPLENLFLSNVVVSSIEWVRGLFSGLVGELQMSDVEEQTPVTELTVEHT